MSSGTFTLPFDIVVPYSAIENGSGVPCFTCDTAILTPTGKRPIQELRIGDMTPAMEDGLPRRDLLVSRQHRVLVRSKIAERMFGTSEVLTPAIRLTVMPGIFVDETVAGVEYFHLLFDRHQVIFAENAPTEILFTGSESLKSLGAEARREVLGIFPELIEKRLTPRPARFIPCGRQQARLLGRHRKNDKPLLREHTYPVNQLGLKNSPDPS